MSQITIQKGSNGDFTVLDPAISADEAVFNVGSGVLIPQATPGNFTCRMSGGDVLFTDRSYRDIINGDTGLTFASAAALKTYIRTNFFRKAGGSSGLPTGGTTGQALVKNSNTDGDFTFASVAKSLVPTAVKTGAYTAAAFDLIPVDTTSGNVPIALPAAPADKTLVAVKQIIRGGTNTVGITTGGSDVFNKTGGGTTLTLTLLNQGVILQYNSAAAIWYVLADDLSLAQLDLRFAAAGTGGFNPGWINVKDVAYGAVGNGTTDDTTAIQAAIAAIPSTGGVLYFPPGKYLVSSTLTFNNPTTIQGCGGILDYTGTVTPSAVSVIIFNSTTANCIDIEANCCAVKDIAIYNNQTTPTAGAGLFLNKAVGFSLTNSSVLFFYNNLDFENGNDWSLLGGHFIKPIHNNLIIKNNAVADWGDQSISHCWFYSNVSTVGVYQIQYTSAGGLKITNTKFNGLANTYYGGINIAISTTTTDFLMAGCSIENATQNGINITPSANFSAIVISGNEIQAGFPIYADGTVNGGNITGITVIGNHLSAAGSNPCITVNNTDWVTIGPNTYNAGKTTSFTNVFHLNVVRSKIPVTLTGTTPTYDFNAGNFQQITLTGNTTLTLGAYAPGEMWYLKVGQDGTGGRTLSVSGGFSINSSALDLTANNFSYIVGYENIYTIYSNAGSAALQAPIVQGGSTSGGTLTLKSTTNATKGKILLGTSGYDEVNNRLGVGTASPGVTFDVLSTSQAANFSSSSASDKVIQAAASSASYAANLIMGYTGRAANSAFNLLFLQTSNATVTQFSVRGDGQVFAAGSLNLANAQTTVSGSTSGNAVFSQPFQGTSYKVVIIKLAALVGTAAYTFPTAFATTPSIVATDDIAAVIVTSKSTTAVTVTGSTSTGSITLIGY